MLRFAFQALCAYFIQVSVEKSVESAFSAMLTGVWRSYLDSKFMSPSDWHLFGQIAQTFCQSINVLSVRLVDQYHGHLLHPKYWSVDFVPDHEISRQSNMLRDNDSKAVLRETDFINGPELKHCLWHFHLFRRRGNDGRDLQYRGYELNDPQSFSWKSFKAHLHSPPIDNLSTLAFLTNASSNFFIDGKSSLFRVSFGVYMHALHLGPGNLNPMAPDVLKGYTFESFVQSSLVLASVKGKSNFYGTPLPEACLEISRNLSKSLKPCIMEASNKCALTSYFAKYKKKLTEPSAFGSNELLLRFLEILPPRRSIGLDSALQEPRNG